MVQVSLTLDARTVSSKQALRMLALSTSPAGLSVFLHSRARNWLQERAEARFGSGGDDASGPWKPLADSTQLRRRQLGYGGSSPINVRTGFLKGSVTAARGDMFVDALGATLIWPGGTMSPQIEHRYHQAQLGNNRTRGPARPVVAMNLTDAGAILRLLGDFVLGPEMRAVIR